MVELDLEAFRLAEDREDLFEHLRTGRGVAPQDQDDRRFMSSESDTVRATLTRACKDRGTPFYARSMRAFPIRDTFARVSRCFSTAPYRPAP